MPLAAFGPDGGEVEIFDRDRAAAVLAGEADQLADRAAEPAVPLRGGQAG